MIRPQKFQAVVENKQQLNDKVFNLTFLLKNPDQITFSAGQRGLFNIGPKFNNYSLCSLPSEKSKVSICVDTTPQGPGSKWIIERKIGDNVEFIAPIGNFMLSASDKPKIFLATGSGVSPLHSMIGHLLENKFAKDIFLYFGERYESDTFWMQEFINLQASNNNFHYKIVLSKPQESWQGGRGYVQEVMDKDLFSPDNFHNPLEFEYYICGNGRMIASSTQLLFNSGVQQSDIHSEKFYDV
ncbi:hypothetical protein HYT02_05400 [Candidatus Gottesmanbacteria bacterium]|nr:hypothetical protein [Candidatus Gottesmanbacteria bacterium]